MDHYFLPLGGADEVGASAYFVQVDGVRMLFDCGARINGNERYPDYRAMLDVIDDYGQLDYIFLSHAHYDHIGSFPYIACLANQAEIMATKATKELTRLQLLEFGRLAGKQESERILQEKYCRTEDAIGRIKEMPVMKSCKRADCTITFYPAGHMAGASMILVETAQHKVLYTGDFSTETMSGVNQLRLPDQKPDLVIMNGVHAYHREKKVKNRADDPLFLMEQKLAKGKNVYVHSQSIAKHLDLFYALQGQKKWAIDLSEESEQIGKALSDLGYGVFSPHMRAAQSRNVGQHVLVGTKETPVGYEAVNFDLYSLHASYADLQTLVKQWPASKIYLVHTNPKELPASGAMQRTTLSGPMVQAENKKIYTIW